MITLDVINKLLKFKVWQFTRFFQNEFCQIIGRYFIEGFANRKNDVPVSGSHDFARYIVKNESQAEEIVFLKSKKTERWWIDLSYGREKNKQFERHYFVPCSKDDYELAKKEEIPDRWWQFYQKLM